jgi:acetylornithine deacetylase/succinyl-diaminopimelate desuccinylase-like protein
MSVAGHDEPPLRKSLAVLTRAIFPSLSAAGISCVVFGPGDIAQAHTSDEWISLTQLERATTILERFLLSLP